MKILSNSKYDTMMDQLRFRAEWIAKLNSEVKSLKETINTLQQERLRLNLTRDEKGVLHRIVETKTSRINRKAKADDTVRYSSEYFSDPVDVSKSVKHANKPKTQVFEPKEGEICVLFGLLCGEIICYFNNTESVFGINEAGQFGSYLVSPKDTFLPATEAEKAQLQKLDPQSEYNLRKMIDSKSPKELATEYLGLKVGDGEICGYDNEDVILGFSSDFGWHSIFGGDIILSEHESYLYAEDDLAKEVKQAILKSLNPR